MSLTDTSLLLGYVLIFGNVLLLTIGLLGFKRMHHRAHDLAYAAGELHAFRKAAQSGGYLGLLRATNIRRGREWMKKDVDEGDLAFMGLELGGESGEVQNAVKKYLRHKGGVVGGVDREKSIRDIAHELADVLICADRIASVFDIDLETAVTEKFNITSEKNKLNTLMPLGLNRVGHGRLSLEQSGTAGSVAGGVGIPRP